MSGIRCTRGIWQVLIFFNFTHCVENQHATHSYAFLCVYTLRPLRKTDFPDIVGIAMQKESTSQTLVGLDAGKFFFPLNR
jgi:hypothetical protein